jgi:hypothetical protein
MASPSSVVSLYTTKWKLTRYGKKIHISNISLGKQIGKKSSYGKVTQLLNKGVADARFVLKYIQFRNHTRKYIFNNEVRVGSKRNIQRVGPRVLAWRYTRGGGEYIMDDVRLGNTRAKTETVQDLIERGGLTRKFIQQVFKKVREFHKVTGGQHGDLHGENMMVVKSHGKTFIKIIDYGSFRKNSELTKLGKPYKHLNGVNIFKFDKGQLYVRNQNRLMRAFYE